MPDKARQTKLRFIGRCREAERRFRNITEGLGPRVFPETLLDEIYDLAIELGYDGGPIKPAVCTAFVDGKEQVIHQWLWSDPLGPSGELTINPDSISGSTAIFCQTLFANWVRDVEQDLEPTPEPKRLEIDLDNNVATLDGERIALTPDQAVLLDILLKAKNGWVSGPKIRKHSPPIGRPDRVLDRMPAPIQQLIERKSKGYRLTLE